MESDFDWNTFAVELAANDDMWHWAKPEKPLTLPDFMEMRAKGRAKIVNGVVYVLAPGPDPIFFELKMALERLEQKLYEGDMHCHLPSLCGEKVE